MSSYLVIIVNVARNPTKASKGFSYTIIFLERLAMNALTSPPIHFCKEAHSKMALIAEGGGQRGIFTAGVLDAWLENDFDPFNFVYRGVGWLAKYYKLFISSKGLCQAINP